MNAYGCWWGCSPGMSRGYCKWSCSHLPVSRADGVYLFWNLFFQGCWFHDTALTEVSLKVQDLCSLLPSWFKLPSPLSLLLFRWAGEQGSDSPPEPNVGDVDKQMKRSVEVKDRCLSYPFGCTFDFWKNSRFTMWSVQWLSYSIWAAKNFQLQKQLDRAPRSFRTAGFAAFLLLGFTLWQSFLSRKLSGPKQHRVFVSWSPIKHLKTSKMVLTNLTVDYLSLSLLVVSFFAIKFGVDTIRFRY